MRKISRFTSTLLLLLLAIVASFASDAFAMEKADAKNFDFAKTREFFQDMESRPDFPVSTVLAYDYVYSLRALGETIEPARKKSIIKYLQEAQQKDGGFIGGKANNDASALFTDIALDTLAYLDNPGALDTEAAKKFILSLKNSDGGFGFCSASRESTMATTYFAVKILGSLNALSSVDKAKTASFIKGFERKETGGFGYMKGNGVAAAKITYMAVYALNELGMLDETTRKNSLRFLEATPCGTKSSNDDTPDLNELSYALQAAKVLTSKNAMDDKKVLTFLGKIYIPVNGGFGPLEGYGSTPDSTSTALRILVEIGKLKTPAMSPLVKQ